MKIKKDTKWQMFERLVASIHHAEKSGGKVIWNDNINGRQFDITLRFQHGLYEYLTIIECKNNTRPISVDKLEAFITKSKDAKSDKSIMVSSSGYQQGCITIAEKHNIELFSLTEINNYSIQEINNFMIPALNIYGIKFFMDNLNYVELPEQNNILQYLFRDTIISCGGMRFSLGQYFRIYFPRLMKSITKSEQIFTVPITDTCNVFIPTLDNSFAISSISFKYKLQYGQKIMSQGFDPYLLQNIHRTFEYKNIFSHKSKKYSMATLPIGFDTKLEEGKFYFCPTMGFSYYCVKLEGNLAHMILVESYQHGTLFQAKLSMTIDCQNHYIEIIDCIENRRLTRLLQKIKS